MLVGCCWGNPNCTNVQWHRCKRSHHRLSAQCNDGQGGQGGQGAALGAEHTLMVLSHGHSILYSAMQIFVIAKDQRKRLMEDIIPLCYFQFPVQENGKQTIFYSWLYTFYTPLVVLVIKGYSLKLQRYRMNYVCKIHDR